MQIDLIHSLTDNFEAHAQQTEGGLEFWFSREVTGHAISDHFVDVNKTIQMPKGAEKKVEDIMLSR